MESLLFRPIQCPYCGEMIEIAVDESAGEQDLIEDCSVCCRPIELRLIATAGGLLLQARRDDE